MDTMICSKCKTTKPQDQFPWKNKTTGVRKSHCFACAREYCRDHYRKNKAAYLEKNKRNRRSKRRMLLALLNTKACVDCNEKNPILLDFDHVRDTKQHCVSRMVNESYSWEAILKEIAKCEVRCVKCHRLKTAREFKWYENH